MATATVDDYLAGKHPVGVGLFRGFEELVRSCGAAEVSVSKTVVYFKRKRVFAGAFVRGRRLEVVIDLLREIEHPLRIGSFRSTEKVISHRLRISDPGELDGTIAALLCEAYEEVGPGTKRDGGG